MAVQGPAIQPGLVVESHPEPGAVRPSAGGVYPYRIVVQGQLALSWTPMLGDIQLAWDEDGNTALTGESIDQAALHGLLARLRDLGLTLLSVARLEPERGGCAECD